MYISIKELEILQEIEKYLYNINKDTITQLDNNFVANIKDLKDKYAMELYIKLYSINDKLLKEREKGNNKAKINMANKRKNNKMYGRSKKEILAHKKAINNREKAEV